MADKKSVFMRIKSLFGLSEIDDDFYDELEEQLIEADIGVRTTEDIIEGIREREHSGEIKNPSEAREFLISDLKKKMADTEADYEFENQCSVILMVGVNGVGKTTSIGKLAMQYKAAGKKVLLAAADTFRAGAIAQLGVWAERAGVDMIAQKEGSDPAAVIYDAVAAARSRKADILICDTAGRLQNKKNLMDELRKIYRILEREYPEGHVKTLIVLDGTTGQNALSQAREFSDAAHVDGIVLTKMDGSAKGGIAVAVQSELGIPVLYIGEGEKIEDLHKFNADSYVDELFA
ncbi:MAG: signal recognition particle-docking protein FtsY [Lachnospiraceae bacterium]|nr:signal recognition particle-docking protein FtsY [Candidatus Minthocola equi]